MAELEAWSCSSHLASCTRRPQGPQGLCLWASGLSQPWSHSSWLGTSSEMSHRLPYTKPVSVSFSVTQITLSPLLLPGWEFRLHFPTPVYSTWCGTCLSFPLQFCATFFWKIVWILFVLLPSYLASSFQKFLNCLRKNEAPFRSKCIAKFCLQDFDLIG